MIRWLAKTRLRTSLLSADWAIRMRALRNLGELGDPSTIWAVVGCLQDPNRDVRMAAADTLTKFGTNALPHLLAALDSTDEELVMEAIDSLAEIGHPGAVPDLQNRLTTSGFGVRVAAADALGVIGDRRAVPALIRSLEDDKEPVMRAACKALARIRDERALWPLIANLSHPDRRRRYNAILPLWNLGDIRSLIPMSKVLHDAEPRLRVEAAEAIARMGYPQGVALLERSRDGDQPQRVLEVIEACLLRLKGRVNVPRVARPHSAPSLALQTWKDLCDEEQHMWNRFKGGFRGFKQHFEAVEVTEQHVKEQISNGDSKYL